MASRSTNRLSDLAVRKTRVPGYHADGGGLYLKVDERGPTKTWVYKFQWQKKRAEMGLGALADISLGEARDARDAARKLVVAGKNPIEERRLERARTAVKPMTFGEWAEEAAPVIGPRAAKAAKAWLKRMQVKVGALAAMAPAEIQTEHVLTALKPYWTSRPETGRRMRMAIERVLDSAKSKGLIVDPWNNPARLKGHLENLLPARSTKVKHHAALPYEKVPEFWRDLQGREQVSALALRFTLLTVGRTTEVLGASWPEIDRKEKVWTVPPERMKGPVEKRREHRVPLTAEALAVLDLVEALADKTPHKLVFPSVYGAGKRSKTGRLSDAAMERVMEDMGLKGVATPHGLRSTFKDWAEDTTNFPNGVIEAALAHLVGDETERAYRRSDALVKRRKLMEAWSGYLTRPAAAGNVRQLGRTA